MISAEWQKIMQKAVSVRWPCDVCGIGVGYNSIHCTSCQKWVYMKYSGIKGSMYKVMKIFVCRGCMNPVNGTGCTSVDIGVNANLELVNRFCYLGDMLSVDVFCEPFFYGQQLTKCKLGCRHIATAHRQLQKKTG